MRGRSLWCVMIPGMLAAWSSVIAVNMGFIGTVFVREAAGALGGLDFAPPERPMVLALRVVHDCCFHCFCLGHRHDLCLCMYANKSAYRCTMLHHSTVIT